MGQNRSTQSIPKSLENSNRMYIIQDKNSKTFLLYLKLYKLILCQPFHSKDGNDVTETYCSEKEWQNPDVNIGQWINTNAQVLDFTFQLDVPLNEDNALYIAGLYTDYISWGGNPAYDYDYYMTGMNDLSKYEVLFKCVQEPTSTPAPSTVEPETINTFYVNGLDQEYFFNFSSRIFK